MKLINYTPHTINLPNMSIPPCGEIARCEEITKEAFNVNKIQFVYKTYGKVTNLPDNKSEVIYIVSMMVRQALPNRYDLASPGDLIRDENGQITGCLNLVIN